ncbi:MAG: histidine kinase, partial [Candidatus Riflebacteria bacterium]|nr:histidine kinase [Candidatus Riflebacteria bacterium]
HEINNPLSNIKLYSQIIAEDDALSDPTLKASLANIVGETDRATKIVRNLLEVSLQDFPEFVRLEVQEVLDSAAAILRHQLLVEHIETVVQIPDNLPAVWAARGALQQVLINLMTNAQHAMRPSGGTLRIRAWHDPKARRVMISVADSGSGIDPAHLGRIFDPFFTTK